MRAILQNEKSIAEVMNDLIDKENTSDQELGWKNSSRHPVRGLAIK